MWTPAEVQATIDIVDGDGWTIFDPAVFPARVADRFSDVHRSDGTHKGSISVDGQIVDSLVGIYGLVAVEEMCRDLGLAYRALMGRGSQARACCAVLAAWLKAQGSNPS